MFFFQVMKVFRQWPLENRVPAEHLDTQTHSSGLWFCGVLGHFCLSKSDFISFVSMPGSCSNKSDAHTNHFVDNVASL